MTKKLAEWASKRGPISKFRPSDGCKGDALSVTRDMSGLCNM